MLPQLLLPVPVAFSAGCVEGPILVRGVGIVKVAQAIEYLEAEARAKRGRVNLLVTLGTCARALVADGQSCQGCGGATTLARLVVQPFSSAVHRG